MAALLVTGARADDAVHFGPNDVATVFAIGKSDDHNQVQYALRMNADCRPVGPRPVFCYWREYDKGGRLVPMTWLGSLAYGVGTQVVSSEAVVMNVKATPDRAIRIEVQKEPDGSCSATPYTTIQGRRARLSFIFLKLSGPLAVAWAEIRGTDADSGLPVVERVRP